MAKESVRLLSQHQLNALSEGSRLIVRSNGPHEDYWPGETSSFVVPAEMEMVKRAVHELLAASPEGARVFPILQRAVSPVMLGVLSNERRLSQSTNRCVVEAALLLDGDEHQELRAAPSYSPDPLGARVISDLRLRLTELAAFICTLSKRTRCEWGWDGERLWVFQLDPIPDRGNHMAYAFLGHVEGSRVTLPSLPVAGPGPKMDKTRAFAELGMPHLGSLVIPFDEASIETIEAALDERKMLPSNSYPIVVRTDVIFGESSALLPTSGPCHSLTDVMTFVKDAKDAFVSAASPPVKGVLLMAPLVAARASAIAHAEPHSSEPCEVHTIWGFPDGLLTLPHDVTAVSANGSVLTRRTAYKPAGLFATVEGWRMLRLGDPWDWRPVLDDAELRQIAAWARLLANREGASVQLMALARVAGLRGGDACMPFHYTTLAHPPAPTSSMASTCVLVITQPSDLEAARADTDRAVAYELRLESHWLRNSQLLHEIGDLAVERQVPLLYRGSRLSHAFYILHGTGATIVDRARDPELPSRETVTEQRYPYLADIDGFQSVRTEHASVLNSLAQRQLESSREGDLPVGEAERTLAGVRRMLAHDFMPRRLTELPVLRCALLDDAATDRERPPIVLSSRQGT
jgi:hypothetical protein